MAYRYNYEVHELAKLFPEMTGADYRKLRDDIQKNGQQVPIMLSTDSERLLDGRNRLRALKELGMEPRVDRLEAKHSESDFIWSINVLRRHLTDDQRATIAVKWSDTEKEAAKQRQRLHAGTAPGKDKNTSGESTQSVRTRTVLAQKAEVSEHKIQQAEKLARHHPEAFDEVAKGKTTLKKAVPKRKRKNSVDNIVRAVNRRAKQIEKERGGLAGVIAAGADRTTSVAVHVEPREPQPEMNVRVKVEPASPPTSLEQPLLSDFFRSQTLEQIAAWNMEETVRQCFAHVVACAKHLDTKDRERAYAQLADKLNSEIAFQKSDAPDTHTQ